MAAILTDDFKVYMLLPELVVSQTRATGQCVYGAAVSESGAGAVTKTSFMGVSLGLMLFPPPSLISIFLDAGAL